MQETTRRDSCVQYFAAANGYEGFRSYFSDIFNPSEFERIFVLKGGPGTGKSSLMRKLAEFGSENEYSIEKILCSSDPHSLDAVILEKNKKRFAVLDGTSPHTRDAEIPGALDEIVNLGENWNDAALIKNRGLICELNRRKKRNYADAYRHLSYAGKIMGLRSEMEKACIDNKNLKISAKSAAESLFKNERTGTISLRLISSFGRFGLFCVNTLEALSEAKISVKNRGTVTYEYMNILSDELSRLGCEMTVFPNVFDVNNTEAIFLHESKTAIIIKDSESCDIDPSEFLKNKHNIPEAESFDALYKSLSDGAQKFFTFASDLHFELEKIYIAAMNFKDNDAFLEKISKKIKNLSL